MPNLTHEELAELADVVEALITQGREQGDETLLFEGIYRCLLELENWRDCFPDTELAPLYETPFGILGEQ